VPVVIALLLTLAYAACYASVNQSTYLLDPMHRAMPELFHRDWFMNTLTYMPVFGWITQWLYVLDHEGPTAFLVVQLLTNFATYAAIYWLVRTFEGGWRAFAIVAGFLTATKGLSMGGNYLLAGYFQPSSLSTLGWIVGLAALARGRYWMCGIAVACAGALHANFLVLGIGLFGLTALTCRELTWRDQVKVMAPQLAVLVFFLPTLLAAAGPNEEAVWVLTKFHAPIHYAPPRLTGWVRDVVGWQVGAYGALSLLPKTKSVRVVWWFSLVALVVVVASALLIQYTRFESLTQVRWSRVAPFGQLACATLIAAGLVRQVVSPQPLSPVARIAIGIALLVPLYYTRRYLHLVVSREVIWTGAACIVISLLPWRQVARVGLGALAVVVMIYAIWMRPPDNGLTTTIYATDDEIAMTSWVRTQTPVDALFLAPPDLYRFRLLARRAVIADSKSPPLRPDLLVEWHHRLCAMVRMPEAQSFLEVEARYPKLSPTELGDIARSFGAEYVLVRGTAPFAYAPVFHNDEFSIYKLP
jgi:hypothetical protein